MRRKRAITLLYTTTTQKVAWPMAMVQKPGVMSASRKADSKAMPVMMPGSAIGRINIMVMASLPKITPVQRGGSQRAQQQRQHRGQRRQPQRQADGATTSSGEGSGKPAQGEALWKAVTRFPH
jgi:hypothetical protein